jgi:hypothetical protein
MGTRILAYYQKPDWLTKHLFNPVVASRTEALVCAGLASWLYAVGSLAKFEERQ